MGLGLGLSLWGSTVGHPATAGLLVGFFAPPCSLYVYVIPCPVGGWQVYCRQHCCHRCTTCRFVATSGERLCVISTYCRSPHHRLLSLIDFRYLYTVNPTGNISSHTTCSPTPAAAAHFTSSHATVTVFVTVWPWPLTFLPPGQCCRSTAMEYNTYRVWCW